MHANNREDRDVGQHRRHRRRHRAEEHPHRRHAVRPGPSDRPREARLPRAGHPRRRGAQDQGRPGQDVQGARRPLRGGPDVPGPHRRGDGPDHHLRAWASSTSRCSSTACCGSSSVDATVGTAAGRLPGDHHQRRPEGRSTPHEADRRRRAVRRRGHLPSSPPVPVAATSSSDNINGGVIPRSTSPPSTRASSSRMSSGPLAGYPMVDFKVDAGRRRVPRRRLLGDGLQDRRQPWCCKEAARPAKPVLLEPVMRVEVVTPEDYMGDVIGDLNSRRGRVGKMEQRGNSQVISAQVPLPRCSATPPTCARAPRAGPRTRMHFGSYQQVPTSIADEIVRRVRGE